MWDSLQITHEGLNYVKLARINTLTQELDLFHMEDGETIADMQTIFSHLINRLNALGTKTPNDVATNKILRCLNRDWLPKVTAIKEANDLRTLDMTTLFGKLQEHEQELMNLEKHEKNQKKEKKEKDKNTERKSIALKASRYKSSTNDVCESESSDDDKESNEDMRLFVMRYNRYLRKMKSNIRTKILSITEGNQDLRIERKARQTSQKDHASIAERPITITWNVPY
jgi:hypothetical protein